VVVAELDQDVGRGWARAIRQRGAYALPGPVGAKALRAAPAAREIEAGDLPFEEAAQRVAVAGARSLRGIAHQEHADIGGFGRPRARCQRGDRQPGKKTPGRAGHPGGPWFQNRTRMPARYSRPVTV